VFVWGKRGDGVERAEVAVRAASGIASREAPIEVLPGLTVGTVGLGRCGFMEELSYSCDEARATAVGLETEVPNTDEAAREHVQEESLDEMRRFEGKELLGTFVLSIAITKGHEALVEGHQRSLPMAMRWV
jgi:hypothetical protein